MATDKHAVLDAATRLFASNPAATTQEVAGAAGISRATLHRLFPSRNVLIEEIGALAVTRLGDAYASARLDDDPVPRALARLIHALIPLVHQFAFLIAETQIRQSEPLMTADRELQEQTVRLVQRGQSEGSIRGDLPAAWIAHTLAGLLVAAEEAVSAGDIAPRETTRLVLESFLRGAGQQNAAASVRASSSPQEGTRP